MYSMIISPSAMARCAQGQHGQGQQEQGQQGQQGQQEQGQQGKQGQQELIAPCPRGGQVQPRPTRVLAHACAGEPRTFEKRPQPWMREGATRMVSRNICVQGRESEGESVRPGVPQRMSRT